jgi:Holliday junction resolvasome RuvABC endonuclease subunit
MSTTKTPEVVPSSLSGTTSGTTPTVIGLDLSITATGVACPARTFTITGHAKGDLRLVHIGHTITTTVAPLGEPIVDLAVIEDLPTHAHGAGITGMVHGVVRDRLLQLRVPYVLVPPASLKKYATGKGNSPKSDMRMALYQRTGVDLRDDNQVDAEWLRLMGLDALGHPVIDLPKVHREALAKVAWPQVVTSP